MTVCLKVSDIEPRSRRTGKQKIIRAFLASRILLALKKNFGPSEPRYNAENVSIYHTLEFFFDILNLKSRIGLWDWLAMIFGYGDHQWTAFSIFCNFELNISRNVKHLNSLRIFFMSPALYLTRFVFITLV